MNGILSKKIAIEKNKLKHRIELKKFLLVGSLMKQIGRDEKNEKRRFIAVWL